MFRAMGDWTRDHAGALNAVLAEELDVLDYDFVEYDFSDVESLDTVGAFLFARAIRIGPGQRHSWSVTCLLYTSPSPRDRQKSRMPSSA